MDPPAADALEVSVFGRGTGESVLCHVGDRRWVVVDSFHGDSGEPIATEYLSRLRGRQVVAAAVVTHWDDDHIRGMASVIKRWQPAQVWMPVVLRDNELIKFAVEHVEALADIAPSGLADFAAVMRLTARKGVRKWGSDGHRIRTGTDTEVVLLSPTHDFIGDALVRLGINHAPGELEVTSVESNATSIVLWISSNGRSALLGADLERSENGWEAVVDQHPRERGRADVVKVPHHGSEDADDPRVWSEMAAGSVINVVTRYTALADPRPRGEDISRIVRRAGDLHIAGELPERVGPTASAFDFHLDAAAVDGLRPSGAVGLVRLRRSPRDGWTIERFGAVQSALRSGLRDP